MEITAGTHAAARARTRGVAAHSSLIVPLFASTMFLSGFLLFMVEPMAARMRDQTSAVWNRLVVWLRQLEGLRALD